MIKMRRGTTPYLLCEVTDDVDLSSIKSVWLTITQGEDIVLDFITDDVHINNNNIAVALSQEDTLKLKAGIAGAIQIRLLNDSDIAYASQKDYVSVEGVLKDGVIT